MILHVDLNSFYAHCAVLKSGGKYSFETPLMVCGDPKLRHGVVLAATYPLKRLGIRAGMPLFEARARCPNAVIAEPDFALYLEYSERFMHIIRSYSPLVMRYGLDEAYLDYAGCEGLFGPPEQAAHAIRRRVKGELGLTVSVGVGENMTMAKMGSDFKKPDAVTVLTAENWRQLIWPLPVGSLMYVGRATEQKLRAIGICTVGQLACCGQKDISALFGKAGRDVWLRANGQDSRSVGACSAPQKGIGNSATLAKSVATLPDVQRALLAQTEHVAYRLRRAGFCAGLVAIHLRYDDFSSASRQATLLHSTNVTAELCAEVRRLAAELYGRGSVRQVGVRVGRLGRAEQLSLLGVAGHERQQRLDEAVDALKLRYGEGVVHRGAAPRAESGGFSDFCPFRA